MMKQTLLVVDTDQEFANRFGKRLAYNKLDSRYEVINIVPNTSLDTSNMVDDVIDRVVSEISNKYLDVVAFFVDIVVIERGTELDSLGIDIANRLHESFPNIPAFNVTGKITSDQQLDIFSDAALANRDGVFPKTYLEGKSFNGDRLKNILAVRGGCQSESDQKKSNKYSKCDVAILTALHDDEFENIRTTFDWTGKVENDDRTFHLGKTKNADGGNVNVVATYQDKSGIVDAAVIATELINFFRPKYLIMPGVCGGGKSDQKLGDIIFASEVFLFQKGKEGEKGFEPDVDRCEIDQKIVARVREVKKDLIRQLEDSDKSRDYTKTKMFIAPMACSLSVINREGYFSECVTKTDRNAVAVDMESFAIARVCVLSGESETKAIIVKAVMDKTAGKTDEAKAFAGYVSAMVCKLLINEVLSFD